MRIKSLETVNFFDESKLNWETISDRLLSKTGLRRGSVETAIEERQERRLLATEEQGLSGITTVL